MNGEGIVCHCGGIKFEVRLEIGWVRCEGWLCEVEGCLCIHLGQCTSKWLNGE